jgi:hypothetical protein
VYIFRAKLAMPGIGGIYTVREMKGRAKGPNRGGEYTFLSVFLSFDPTNPSTS